MARLSRRRALVHLAASVATLSLGGALSADSVHSAGIVHSSEPVHSAEPSEVPPSVSARAVAAIDWATGRLLYARRAFDEVPPASLTKMVTALVALERETPDHLVRPTRDYDVIPTVIGIGAGDTLRLEDALYGLLLNSGNDAALAIAESLADGSVERYVGWMNELVARLDLRHTHFLNPHGLDEEDHYSSAYDLAVIGRTVMRHPVLGRIVGEQRHRVEGPPLWAFRNTNPILGVVPGADGIKTGYEDRAGRCLAATAMRDGRRIIAVVLNSTGTAQDAGTLIEMAFKRDDWGARSPARIGSGAAVLAPFGRPGAVPGGAPVRPAALHADLDAADGAPRSMYRAARLVAPARAAP